MAPEIASPAKRSRTRSPSYPYLDLAAALEKALVLWNVEGRHPAAVSVAMQHWGYKEDSSTGYSCVAALKKFGLVDHEGMGERRQIRLSALALSILLDRDPASPERRDAVRRAALNPRIHGELWERYAAELPSEQTLRRFLVVERNFNEASVDELLAGYKATIAFAGLGPAGTGGGALAPTLLTVAGPDRPLVGTPASRGLQDAREGAAVPEPLSGLAPGGSAATTGARPGGIVAANSAAAASVPPGAFRRETTAPVTGRQTDLFCQPEDRFDAAAASELVPARPDRRAAVEPLTASVLAPVPPAADATPGPRTGARQELPVPLDNGLVARVPYPMSEEDFSLLLDTLQLWKKRLVRG